MTNKEERLLSYIDKEKLLFVLNSLHKLTKDRSIAQVIRIVEKQPTIEPKQAHWEIDWDGYYPYCSECRHEPEGRTMTKFCENCGAEMKGEQSGTISNE